MADAEDVAAPSPALSVRAAGPADRALVSEMARTTIGSELQALSTRGLIDVSGFAGLVAERAGEPAGFATYEITGDTLEVLAIGSLEGRTGTGRALMERLLDHAARAACTEIRVTTTDGNAGARAFYERLDYRVAEVRVGAVDECRRRYKPEIPEGMHDEIEYRRPV